jgi:hypothetical protein
VLLAPPSFDNPRSHLSRVRDRVALDYLIPIGLVRSLGATIGGAQERVHTDKGLTLMPLIPGPPTGYLPSTSGASLSLNDFSRRKTRKGEMARVSRNFASPLFCFTLGKCESFIRNGRMSSLCTKGARPMGHGLRWGATKA